MDNQAKEPQKSSEEKDKAAAVRAWHDCKTDADKAAAVKKFPVLKEIYVHATQF